MLPPGHRIGCPVYGDEPTTPYGVDSPLATRVAEGEKTMLRYVLLGLLADGKPKHGYALMKAYTDRSAVEISVGNVYRELQRLVADELIATTPNPADADPRRSPYAITARGRDALTQWLTAPLDRVTCLASPDPLAYRLSLIDEIDPEVTRQFLDALHADVLNAAKTVEDDQRTTKPDASISNARRIALSRRLQHLTADIELIDELRSAMAARAEGQGVTVSVSASVPRGARRSNIGRKAIAAG